jgi:hypothetical protein
MAKRSAGLSGTTLTWYILHVSFSSSPVPSMVHLYDISPFNNINGANCWPGILLLCNSLIFEKFL